MLELAVVMTILTLAVGIVAMKPFGNIRKENVSEDVKQFADTMRLVAEHAVLTGKTYEVVLEITDCVYTIYETDPEKEKQSKKTAGDEATDEELEEEEEESIFDELTMLISFIEEVKFADGSRQYSGEVVMKATPQGWDKSVLFQTLDDRNEFEMFIRLDQGTPRVTVSDSVLEIQEIKKDISL